MKPDIIDRLKLQETNLRMGDSCHNHILIYTNGHGLLFAGCNCLGFPTPGQVLVIDQKTRTTTQVTEAELRFNRREVVLQHIVQKLAVRV